MAVSGRVYPVDRLLAVYNLAMVVVWAGSPGAGSGATALVVAHGAAVGLPWLLRRAGEPTRPVRWLRRLYPVLWLLAFWAEVDLVRRRLHASANDPVILRLEEALLGVHPHELWMPAMPDVWLSELLYGSYFAYYAALAGPVLWLVYRRREEALMGAQLRMMATFGACFLLFALFPVDGPQHSGTPFVGPNTRAPFARLVTLVAGGSGESLGAAFPSSHVAGAVTMAWVGRLYLPRWAFRLLVAEAIGVFLSTFYIQRHYVLDSMAGLVLAVVVQGVVVPVALKALRHRAASPAVVPPLRRLPALRAPRKERAA